MGPDQLRVYRIPFSTNVERVALALAHKGMDVEWVDVDSADRSPVREISGQDFVPVLVDGDLVLHDSPRILEHLEERFPEPPLLPRQPARREELRSFLDWFNQVWKRAPNLIAAEEEKPHPDADLIAELERELEGGLPRFERLLQGRDFIFGDELSMATSPRSRFSSMPSSGTRATTTAFTRSSATPCRSVTATPGSRGGSTGSMHFRGRRGRTSPAPPSCR